MDITAKDSLRGDTVQSREFGESFMKKALEATSSEYYVSRNRRFIDNRRLASGNYDMDSFKDRLDMAGVQYTASINWKAPKYLSTLLSRLLGRWMSRQERIVASAVDKRSVRDRNDEIAAAKAYMDNIAEIQMIEQETGQSIIPPGQFIPKNDSHLKIWSEDEFRLPQEINFEKKINEIFTESGFYGSVKRGFLRDASETGLISAKVWLDSSGYLRMRKSVPENMIYGPSSHEDFRDVSYVGEAVSYTISEIREMFPSMKEEDLFDIVSRAKRATSRDSLTWQDSYITSQVRPYDDFSVELVELEYKTYCSETFVEKRTAYGKTVVDKKKSANDEKNVSTKTKGKYDIYEGVCVRDTGKLIHWGKKKNMIRPQDPTRISEAYFSWALFMPEANDMRNISIPEKAEEPIEQMILCRLKIQHLVAKMRPSGLSIDISGSSQLIDIGDGPMTRLKIQAVYDQTGNYYYKSLQDDGETRTDIPIRELPNIGPIQQIQGLINLYNFNLSVLRDETGINEYAEGQSVAPRTAMGVVQQQTQMSFHAVDYIYDAYLSLMAIVADKAACLLHDSASFFDVYDSTITKADTFGRVFSTSAVMMPQEQDIQWVESLLGPALSAGLPYKDAFKVRRLARENVKLAEWYLGMAQEEQQASAQENMQAQAMAQAQAKEYEAMVKVKSEEQLISMKSAADIKKSDSTNLGQKEIEIIRGLMAMYGSGTPIPAELKEVEGVVVSNIIMPTLNKMKQQQQEQMAQDQQEAMMQQQAMEDAGAQGQEMD